MAKKYIELEKKLAAILTANAVDWFVMEIRDFTFITAIMYGFILRVIYICNITNKISHTAKDFNKHNESLTQSLQTDFIIDHMSNIYCFLNRKSHQLIHKSGTTRFSLVSFQGR